MIRLILCLGLTFAVPAASLDMQNVSPADMAAIDAEIRSYLIAHPEVLMEALQALDAKQAAAQAESYKSLVKANTRARFHDGHSWFGGNPDGDVTMVEFMYYRCPYCRQTYDQMNQLVRSDG